MFSCTRTCTSVFSTSEAYIIKELQYRLHLEHNSVFMLPPTTTIIEISVVMYCHYVVCANAHFSVSKILIMYIDKCAALLVWFLMQIFKICMNNRSEHCGARSLCI